MACNVVVHRNPNCNLILKSGIMDDDVFSFSLVPSGICLCLPDKLVVMDGSIDALAPIDFAEFQILPDENRLLFFPKRIKTKIVKQFLS